MPIAMTYTCPSCGHTWHDTAKYTTVADCPQCERLSIPPILTSPVPEQDPIKVLVHTPQMVAQLQRVGAIDNAHALRAGLQEFGLITGQTIELASLTITLR